MNSGGGKGIDVTNSAVRGPTLVDAIRDMVVSGELAPGSRVTEPQLATRFGVSRVPVREALRVLAAEGFIDLRPYGSPTVQRLTEDVIREVCAGLIAFCLAARRQAIGTVGPGV